MHKYFVIVYKGTTTKWVSVNLIITVFFVINLSIKCIVNINAAVAHFYFSIIFDKWKKSLFKKIAVPALLIHYIILT